MSFLHSIPITFANVDLSCSLCPPQVLYCEMLAHVAFITLIMKSEAVFCSIARLQSKVYQVLGPWCTASIAMSRAAFLVTGAERHPDGTRNILLWPRFGEAHTKTKRKQWLQSRKS